jgi:hypothetical protein
MMDELMEVADDEQRVDEVEIADSMEHVVVHGQIHEDSGRGCLDTVWDVQWDERYVQEQQR